jgi:hypothetical protein
MGMNIENVDKWLDALESGAYQQCRGRLRGGDRFCCLGVGCDVSGIDRWVNDPGWESKGMYLGHGGLMPPEVMEWFGITEISFGVLAELNDSGWTFAQIANYIRESPEYKKAKAASPYGL